MPAHLYTMEGQLVWKRQMSDILPDFNYAFGADVHENIVAINYSVPDATGSKFKLYVFDLNDDRSFLFEVQGPSPKFPGRKVWLIGEDGEGVLGAQTMDVPFK
jgi:hypothetical protein